MLRSICDLKWLQNMLRYASNILSDSLHRKVGEINILPQAISFTSENNYCGIFCVKHL